MLVSLEAACVVSIVFSVDAQMAEALGESRACLGCIVGGLSSELVAAASD
jgi:hypothetical protein